MPAATNRAVLIRVNNAAQLAKKQGAVATIAEAIAPKTIEAKVYDEMVKKLSGALRDQGVDATVVVVEPADVKLAGPSPIWKALALGMLGLGGAYVGYKFIRRGR